MDALTCGICLDELRMPVCTPCGQSRSHPDFFSRHTLTRLRSHDAGHLCCEACITSYLEASEDALTASCPTCRAKFPIGESLLFSRFLIPSEPLPSLPHPVFPRCRRGFLHAAIPDLRSVPKKYHSFILPSIRRLYIPTADDAAPAGPDPRRDLHAQIASLTDRVNGLMHDKMLLMDRCEAAIHARDAHAQGERDERLEKERLEREMRELRKKYDCVKGKYKALKAS